MSQGRKGCRLSHDAAMIFLRHPWAFCSVCVVFVCCFAWISCRGDNFVLYPNHPPLFSDEATHVHEISNGSLQVLSSFLHNSPLNFVFFYAPWCGQSRRAVEEFNIAASLLYGKVTFIAINCWAGSCREKYTLDSFPKFFVYHSKFPGLQYPPPVHYHFDHMVQFLQGVVRPFTYIGRESDFKVLVDQEPEVVISFFKPHELSSKKYFRFFTVALQHYGHISSPRFAVVTSEEVAKTIGLHSSGNVLFCRAFKPPLVYHPSKGITSCNITTWIATNRRQIVTQLTPNATNHAALASRLSKKAAVILFVPLRRKDVSTPLLRLFTKASLAYHNCSCNKTTSTNTTLHDKHKELESLGTAIHKIAAKPQQSICRSLQVQTVINAHHTVRNVCDICHRCRKGCSGNHDNRFGAIQARLLGGLAPRPCSTVLTSYNPSSLVTSVCCKRVDPKTEVVRKGSLFDYENKLSSLIDSIFDNIVALKGMSQKNDHLNVESIKAMLSDETKRLTELASKEDQAKPKPTAEVHAPTPGNVTAGNVTDDDATDGCNRTGHVTRFLGAHCHSNKSVNFFYMDSEEYGIIAERLGVRWGADRVALVIVDVKNEAQYVFDESRQITNDSLVDFVMKSMTSKLERRLRIPPPSGISCSREIVCVTEVTTDSFDDIVINNDQDVLLVFYTPWCGMCINFAPVLLAVARFFQDISQVSVTRIDADQNDLPWNLTVSSYPSIILFPAGRKDSSIAFPSNTPRTATRLIEFIEEHGSEALRVALYGRTDGFNVSEALIARVGELESRLQRVEQEKKLLETRLEAVMMEKALAAFQSARAIKGMRDSQLESAREHEARVTAERLFRESEKSRAASEEKLFKLALYNNQLEQALRQKLSELEKNEESLVKLASEAKKVLSEKQELSILINGISKKLNNLKEITSHFEKRELFLTQKVLRLERASRILTLRAVDYIGRSSKTDEEIVELRRQRNLLTQLVKDAEQTVSGLQASLSSTRKVLDDVTVERNNAVETGAEVKRQLEEMRQRYEELEQILRNSQIPRKKPAS
ncbi:thioredoxin domain-containing protein 11 isoform X2 [Nematostella vectensis]|uniref:thioredoxin domain-containing protein 11 isoform X2 n=1 Tax=Nematostella vectensis TaxID=45351 RepID=UPI0020772824|nr:thioredoxin domain-containing protein 11 isoform X2 [Nematostella vectensis]